MKKLFLFLMCAFLLNRISAQCNIISSFNPTCLNKIDKHIYTCGASNSTTYQNHIGAGAYGVVGFESNSCNSSSGINEHYYYTRWHFDHAGFNNSEITKIIISIPYTIASGSLDAFRLSIINASCEQNLSCDLSSSNFESIVNCTNNAYFLTDVGSTTSSTGIYTFTMTSSSIVDLSVLNPNSTSFSIIASPILGTVQFGQASVEITRTASPTANFTASSTSINKGQSVTFSAASSPCPITSYSWSFQGGSPSTYSGIGPVTVTYNTAGVYDVSLSITSPNGNDTKTKNNYINVIETEYLDFTANRRFVGPGESVTFDNLSYGYGSYTWLFTNLANITTSSPIDVSKIFPAVGLYDVTLIGSGTDAKNKPNYISVDEQYSCSVTASFVSPEASLEACPGEYVPISIQINEPSIQTSSTITEWYIAYVHNSGITTPATTCSHCFDYTIQIPTDPDIAYVLINFRVKNGFGCTTWSPWISRTIEIKETLFAPLQLVLISPNLPGFNNLNNPYKAKNVISFATSEPGSSVKVIAKDAIQLKSLFNNEFHAKYDCVAHFSIVPEDWCYVEVPNKNDVALPIEIKSLLTDQSENVEIQIYPNPTKHLLHVKTNVEITEISILNSLGQQMVVSGEEGENIDVSSLEIGTYYIVFNHVLGKKIVSFVKYE